MSRCQSNRQHLKRISLYNQSFTGGNMINQPNILYVEDDAKSRKVMQMLLVSVMRLPHVTIFEDSVDFLKRAKNLDPKPDIILMDIHLQPHNGFEMLEMLRQSSHFQHTPVVALTASVMNEEVEQLQSAGFDGCIAKPVDMDVFPELLDLILDGKKIWRIVS